HIAANLAQAGHALEPDEPARVDQALSQQETYLCAAADGDGALMLEAANRLVEAGRDRELRIQARPAPAPRSTDILCSGTGCPPGSRAWRPLQDPPPWRAGRPP